MATYASGLRTGPSNDQTVPQHIRFDMTLQYSFEKLPLRPRLAIDIINLFDSHYAYRIGNAFVGSSYACLLYTSEPGKPYIFMMNHQSMFDIVCAFIHVPVNLRFIAKKVLQSIPFLGWYMTCLLYTSRCV